MGDSKFVQSINKMRESVKQCAKSIVINNEIRKDNNKSSEHRENDFTNKLSPKLKEICKFIDENVHSDIGENEIKDVLLALDKTIDHTKNNFDVSSNSISDFRDVVNNMKKTDITILSRQKGLKVCNRINNNSKRNNVIFKWNDDGECRSQITIGHRRHHQFVGVPLNIFSKNENVWFGKNLIYSFDSDFYIERKPHEIVHQFTIKNKAFENNALYLNIIVQHIMDNDRIKFINGCTKVGSYYIDNLGYFNFYVKHVENGGANYQTETDFILVLDVDKIDNKNKNNYLGYYINNDNQKKHKIHVNLVFNELLKMFRTRINIYNEFGFDDRFFDNMYIDCVTTIIRRNNTKGVAQIKSIELYSFDSKTASSKMYLSNRIITKMNKKFDSSIDKLRIQKEYKK